MPSMSAVCSSGQNDRIAPTFEAGAHQQQARSITTDLPPCGPWVTSVDRPGREGKHHSLDAPPYQGTSINLGRLGSLGNAWLASGASCFRVLLSNQDGYEEPGL